MKIHLYVLYTLIFAFKRGKGQGWEGERERERERREKEGEGERAPYNFFLILHGIFFCLDRDITFVDKFFFTKRID